MKTTQKSSCSARSASSCKIIATAVAPCIEWDGDMMGRMVLMRFPLLVGVRGGETRNRVASLRPPRGVTGVCDVRDEELQGLYT